MKGKNDFVVDGKCEKGKKVKMSLMAVKCKNDFMVDGSER